MKTKEIDLQNENIHIKNIIRQLEEINITLKDSIVFSKNIVLTFANDIKSRKRKRDYLVEHYSLDENGAFRKDEDEPPTKKKIN